MLISIIYIYGRVKQNFIQDVYKNMKAIFDQINDLSKNKTEENLFVKNIIVNKDKKIETIIPFIATQKWINQLGNRLQRY